jgi:hypothetical protein
LAVPSHVSKTEIVEQRPPTRFSTLDHRPVNVAVLGASKPDDIARATGVSRETALRVAAAAKRRPLRSVYDLQHVEGIALADVERLRRCALFADDPRIAILDVFPVEDRIFSGRRFDLRVRFVATPKAAVALVSVRVRWAGEPFIVEKRITAREVTRGYVDIRFDREHQLPTGPAAFDVTVFGTEGGEASFRVTCAVLPSNPFSLGLSPNANFVTGTFSARGVRSGSDFVTAINTTLSNGDTGSVAVSPTFTWKFWDGGVGGSLVEQGTGGFGGAIVVPGLGTWGGWITFTSPPGSGIFNKYNGREDMTSEIIMHRQSGGDVSGTITARTMFRFGVNVTEVAGEDYVGGEPGDLWDAAQVLKTIYERTDVSVDFDFRQIHRADVGGFEQVDSESEARDLWNDWSGPSSNHNIDAFVVQLVAIPIAGGGTADGIDGDIPGPTSHSGRSSGVVASKSGFVDATGMRRLHVQYLGMLMAHELGHYLGLNHTNAAGNLMLPSSGATDTTLNYDPQYRTIIRHGWVDIA